MSPKEKDNLHRPLERGLDLDAILCKKTERALRNDFTVAHNSKLYQVEEAIQASKVMLQDGMDGSIRIYSKGQSVEIQRDHWKASEGEETTRDCADEEKFHSFTQSPLEVEY